MSSLDGLVYEHLEKALSLKERLAWLAKENSGHPPLPDEQLALIHAPRGHDSEAREVRRVKCRRQRAGQTALVRLRSRAQDVTAGYGSVLPALQDDFWRCWKLP